MDILIITLGLGLTAAFCPISLAFLLPFVSKVLDKKIKRNIVNSIFFIFGGVFALIFLSLIVLKFLNFILNIKILNYLVISCVSVFIGLWALRIVKIPQYKSYLLKINKLTRKKFNNAFSYGLLYGLITILRIAPLYVAFLFLISASDFIIAVICITIYSILICFPMLLFTFFISTTFLIEKFPKYSKVLDLITGISLLVIGTYYFFLAINL